MHQHHKHYILITFLIVIQFIFFIQAHNHTFIVRPRRALRANSILGQLSRKCGVRIFTKIVGGAEATPKSWPWMAALISKGTDKLFCGGSMISHRHILTAAHCLQGLLPKDVKIRIGAYDVSLVTDPDARDYDAYLFKIHAEYQHRSPYPNDIAIIELKENSDVGDVICLPIPDRDYSGKIATVIGWGFTESGGVQSSKLRQLDLPIWRNEKCNEAIPNLPNRVICAGGEEDKDSCQGDSGGPLMVESSTNKWSVNGIVSAGGRCGEAGVPGIYTDVSRYLDWIDEEVGMEADLLTRLDKFIERAEYGRNRAIEYKRRYDPSDANLRRKILSFIEIPDWFKYKTNLCLQWQPQGEDNGQCGDGKSDRQQICATPNTFTDIYHDATSATKGGCKLKWTLVSDVAPSWFKEARLCYQYLPQSEGECSGSRTRFDCAPIGQPTVDFFDNTKGKNGCLISWSLYIPPRSPGWALNLRYCLRWSGDTNACGLGLKDTVCAYANRWTPFYRDNTGRNTKCQLSWSILTWDY